MLDRMATLMPGLDASATPPTSASRWSRRSPIRGDQLTYYQDAVATEAYLGTARRRVSVRRHARLLDYAFTTAATRAPGSRSRSSPPPTADAGRRRPRHGLGGTCLVTRAFGDTAAIGESLRGTRWTAASSRSSWSTPLVLYRAHNAIGFYTWGDDECCLPRGATRAFLRDDDADRLRLRAGDVLILEEVLGALTGAAADADPTAAPRGAADARRPRGTAFGRRARRAAGAARSAHRRAAGRDRVGRRRRAALPAVPVASAIGGVLVARHGDGRCGNVALADHGRSAPQSEALSALPGRPDGRLPAHPLDRTARRAADAAAAACGTAKRCRLVDAGARGRRCDAVRPGRRAAGARVLQRERPRAAGSRGATCSAAMPMRAEFVVETENDGRAGAALRRRHHTAGGRRPRRVLRATYRIGNGAAGNVGADAIGHVVTAHPGHRARAQPAAGRGRAGPGNARRGRGATRRRPSAARSARSPRPTMPRSPSAMPRVQRAAATLRWTGSWHTVFITVDRRGGGAVDADFEAELPAFVERYRLAGHDLEIDAPALRAARDRAARLRRAGLPRGRRRAPRCSTSSAQAHAGRRRAAASSIPTTSPSASRST